MRVGVMLQTVDNSSASPMVLTLFRQALADMQTAGATLVNNFTIAGNSLSDRNWSGGATWPTGFGAAAKEEQLDCGARFKVDLNAYLASAGSRYKTVQASSLRRLRFQASETPAGFSCGGADRASLWLQSLVTDGQYHPSSNASMMLRLNIPYSPTDYPTATLRADGYVCTCGDCVTNPCRAEFRKVRASGPSPHAGLEVPLATARSLPYFWSSRMPQRMPHVMRAVTQVWAVHERRMCMP